MRPTKETGILTVADVREPRGEGGIEALFNERQQIFELPRSKAALAGRLREALDRGAPVKAVLNPRRGTLEAVEPCGVPKVCSHRRIIPICRRNRVPTPHTDDAEKPRG